MKKIICFLLGLILCPNLFAQVYSNDAELVSEENGNVTLRSSGTADKKKEATALAIKSAFNTLFHSGVAGLKGGTPMIAVPRKDTGILEAYSGTGARHQRILRPVFSFHLPSDKHRSRPVSCV